MDISTQLRADAAAHIEKNVDMHTIRYRQGREIAQTYVNTMIAYARLDVQSGQFKQLGDRMVVEGFCRLEERHFERGLLTRTRRQSFWTSQWQEDIALTGQDDDLWTAFLASLGEICRANGIELGTLSVLVCNKDGKRETRPLPASLVSPCYAEAVGFPYRIAF